MRELGLLIFFLFIGEYQKIQFKQLLDNEKIKMYLSVFQVGKSNMVINRNNNCIFIYVASLKK